MRFALLLFLLAFPAYSAPPMSASDDIECTAQGGCLYVPWHLIERMIEQNKTMYKRIRKLEGLRGCIT